MHDSFVHKTERPWPNPRLRIAAIVGHTTARSCRLWLRTGSPGRYRLIVAPADAKSPQETRVHEFEIENWDRDTTIALDLADLKPNTLYRYALRGRYYGLAEERVLLGGDRPLHFRTHPQTDGPFCFGLFSCHMPYRETLLGKTRTVNAEMWDYFLHVLEHHAPGAPEAARSPLRFVLGAGDQVYADGVKMLDVWRCLNFRMRKEGGRLKPGREAMVSWYRDIYRGYWGFASLRRVFSRFPTYMIWDDHELRDGWGSRRLNRTDEDDELNEIFPELEARGLNRADARRLLGRMASAARQVYGEYQHSHNPPTPAGQYDYAFECGSSAFYVLDGRGRRDIERARRRILGEAQFRRFERWCRTISAARHRFAFVVSAVPLVHFNRRIVNAADFFAGEALDMADDLRDQWEHPLHDAERRSVQRLLFAMAARGVRVCILSGDAHIAAAFRLKDERTGATIYQLTSSAMTYNVPRAGAWLMSRLTKKESCSADGHDCKRLALYSDSNFALIRVDPENGTADFDLYGGQSVERPDGKAARALPAPMATVELRWD